MTRSEDAVTSALDEAIALHTRMRDEDLSSVHAAARAIAGCLESGGRLLIFGNGGSAADAQHVAAELVGRFLRVRRALAAIALTTDPSVMTAVANDMGFDHVFARQIEALGRPGDVACGISTSGESENVRLGLETARRMGLTTIALTGGDGGAVGREADIHIIVPSTSTPRIQEVHRTLLHAICDLVERACSSER
jgi:D-sedoheptulose 7-phosphate isomerase